MTECKTLYRSEMRCHDFVVEYEEREYQIPIFSWYMKDAWEKIMKPPQSKEFNVVLKNAYHFDFVDGLQIHCIGTNALNERHAWNSIKNHCGVKEYHTARLLKVEIAPTLEEFELDPDGICWKTVELPNPRKEWMQ